LTTNVNKARGDEGESTENSFDNVQHHEEAVMRQAQMSGFVGDDGLALLGIEGVPQSGRDHHLGAWCRDADREGRRRREHDNLELATILVYAQPWFDMGAAAGASRLRTAHEDDAGDPRRAETCSPAEGRASQDQTAEGMLTDPRHAGCSEAAQDGRCGGEHE
jgi:hypothetical protein